MKNLKPLEQNLITIYDSIASNCQGQKKLDLINERNKIVIRYDEYERNKLSLYRIAAQDYSQSQTIKKYLLECYGSNKTLDKLKVDIKNLQETHYKAICPYCGISSSGSFDHYLPKGEYPEYAVLAINLIPCCEKCNSIKGERWKESIELIFLNYYYHSIPNEKYLFANMSYIESNNVPTISYEIKNIYGIERTLYKNIETHYEKLKLCTRFEEHANDKLSEKFAEIKLAYSEGESIEQQKRQLKREYNVKIERKGRNDWEVVLLETIIDSDEFFGKIYI